MQPNKRPETMARINSKELADAFIAEHDVSKVFALGQEPKKCFLRSPAAWIHPSSQRF